jgi:hypothetical protein
MTKESKEYENLIGEKVDTSTATLEDLLGETIVETVSEDPKDHWKGLPEFEQDKEDWKTLNVKFRNEADMNAFAKLIGQKLTKKTKGIWYPAHEAEENFLMRWTDDA